ncbi:MAG TPA: serine hydrolase [Bacteroidia bacterium]|jgi:CubicO group peptidase (beta-lactamase class C family)|nr:serine hydrolase [Bacteroidia bacterium]
MHAANMTFNRFIQKKVLLFIFLLFINFLTAQSHAAFADSLRERHHVPELAYARISSTTVYEIKALGTPKLNSARVASLTDKFRIGSNTKTVTTFIAALLVKQGKLSWNTKFFNLFPELKPGSDQAHANLTLVDLVSMRTHLYSYSYYYEKPELKDFSGDETQQRYEFLRWCLKQPALTDTASIHFSNLGYVAAALMMEKVSGKSYKQLVKELGDQLHITFYFGQPNTLDSLQPWGYNKEMMAEAPGDSYKLNWLLAAGNIQVSLPDYVKFIQLQLQGLKGQSSLLSKEEFEYMHYGLPKIALGWFWQMDKDGNHWSSHYGNPGTFLTQVMICKEKDLATLVFMNAQTPEAEEAIEILTAELAKN